MQLTNAMSGSTGDPALGRGEIIKVIEGRGAARRVPMAIHEWINAKTFGAREPQYRQLLDKYPCDTEIIHLNIPKVFEAPADDPSYRWLSFNNPFPPGTALDAVSALDDWAKLDDVLADFPNPNYPGLIPAQPQSQSQSQSQPQSQPQPGGRYRIGHWWYWLFERLWSIRGMENALCDFYENGGQVHRLFRALTDFYKVIISRAKNELGIDAIYTSDDIGMQTNTFFSMEVFREFFKPYYKELIDHVHKLGMHFWLHACGNIKQFIPELVEAGLDVLHPIQKHTMNEKEIAAEFGSKICIWAGLDVQRIIPYGSPEEVRREVRFLYDTYYNRDGRFIITAGNGMTADTPYANLEAFLDEALRYGLEISGDKRPRLSISR
ncbi:MAG: hypothetical protein FWD78_13265 [Treponema sp.]|nr:hypothetical protein [Treponema sp.]